MLHHRISLSAAAGIVLLAAAMGTQAQGAHRRPSRGEALVTANPSGWLQTSTPDGSIDTGNPFFRSFGPNGRSCDSCHRQAQGWTISADEVRQRFVRTNGTDPIFSAVDGAVSPLADVSNVYARRIAYAMLLSRGVLRVGMPMPAHAEFRLSAVDDPYGYASARELSLFRRPLPATNLIWDTAVMWDGRETFTPFKPPMDAGIDQEDLRVSLASQARHAILGHEQAATAPDDAVIAQIVDFESHLFTAQIADRQAG
ncbi:MAG: hypothetical protein ACYC0F_14080, partial [Rhodanobacter sp.]